MGAKQFTIIESLEPTGDCVIEIGSERGDGSTEYFYNYCKKNKLDFYTIDFNPTIIENVKNHGWGIPYCMMGEEFMMYTFPKLNKKIWFAYLDNYDWTWEGSDEWDWVKAQKQEYLDLGIRLKNEECRRVHLEQAIEINKYLVPGGYILIDDTWETETGYEGKGGTVVPYLLNNGYVLVPVEDHNAKLLQKKQL